MPIPTDKKHNLEILISTTKKNNLDFIENVFFENNQHNFPIIIVNQGGKINDPNKKNIRIINTDTKGLSESRNLAIKNSSKKYCLLADDDIIYKTGFYEIIEDAFEENLNSDVITFMMVDESGKHFKKYPDAKWDYRYISSNKNLNSEWLKMCLNCNWNFEKSKEEINALNEVKIIASQLSCI